MAVAPVFGRYQVLEMLGSGAHGRALKVADLEAGGATRVLKVLMTDEGLEGFFSSFPALAALQHPCLGAYFDSGRDPSGLCYFTCEAVAGRPILSISHEGMEISVALDLIVQVCRGLEVLHASGHAHGNLRPSNVLVVEERPGQLKVKLVDYGLPVDPRSPGARPILPFLAPEQLDGTQPDARSDLYSVGALFYDVLTGVHAFPGTSRDDLLQQKLVGRPAPPSSFREELQPGLEGLILSMLDPDPFMRPPSVQVVLQQLESLGVGATVEGDPTGQLRLSLVGRDRAIAAIDQAVEQLRTGRGQVLILSGSTGMGKSRMLRELRARLQKAVIPIHEARAEDPRDHTGPVRQLLVPVRSELDSIKDIAARHSASLLPLVPELAPTVPPPLRLLGTLDPRGRGTPYHLAVADDLASFLFEISTSPRALLIDDVHRGAQSLQRLIAQLILRLEEGPLLLAVTLDPASVPDESPLSQVLTQPGVQRLDLTGLARSHLESLLVEAIGRPRGWQALVDAVEKVTEGSPALVEQALRALVQGEALSVSRGQWRVSERAIAAALSGLSSAGDRLFHARMMGLKTAEKRVLQAVSVLGASSPDLLVAVASPVVTASSIDLVLQSLRRAGLLIHQEETRLWQLAHLTHRGALTAQVDPSERRSWHRRAAEHLEARRDTGGAIDRLAYHWIEADDELRAIGPGLRALDTQEGLWRLEEALELALRLASLHMVHEEDAFRVRERAARLALMVGELRRSAELAHPLEELSLGDGRGRLRWRVYRLLGQICLRSGQYEEARRNFQTATEQLPETVLLPDRLGLTVEYILARMLTGKAENADRLAASTLESVTQPDELASARQLLFLWSLRVHLAGILGKLPEAEGHTLKGVQLAQACASRFPGAQEGLRADLAQLFLSSANAFYYQGRYPETVKASMEALMRFQEVGDLAAMCQAHNLCALSYSAVGDLRNATGHFERMRNVARRAWSPQEVATADNHLGVMHRIGGRFDRAQGLLEEGLTLARQQNMRRLIGVLLGNLGEVYHRRGDFPQARRHYDEAIEGLKFTGKADLAENFRRGVELALDEDNLKGFELKIAEALSFARAQARPDEEGYLLALLGVYAARMGRLKEAMGHFKAGEEALGTVPAPYAMARLKLYQGRVALESSSLLEAEEALRAAEKLFKSLDATVDLKKVQEALRDLEDSAQGQTQANKKLEVLLELNRSLNTELDLARLLDAIVEKAIVFSRGERGFIILFDEAGQPRLHSSRSMGREEVAGRSSQLSSTVVRRVMSSGEPITITNVDRDMELRSQKSVVSLGLRSIVCLPIRRGKKMLGVLYVDSSLPIEDFYQRDQSILEALVDGAAIAIENAQLVDALRRKSDLMSILAHEFRSPITATLLLTRQLLRQNEGISAEVRESLGGIEAQSLRLSRMITNILDLARLEAKRVDWEMGPAHIQEMLKATVRSLTPLAREKDLLLAIQVEPPDLTTHGNMDRLIQVCTNLLANSLRFAPVGSMIVLGAGVLAESAAGATLTSTSREQWVAPRLKEGQSLAEGRCIQVEIIDNGPGIPPEDLSRIFERFEQSGSREQQEQGTGLGLSIAREIVAEHGGRIWAENLAGGGAAFRFTLPMLVQSR